MEGLDHPLSKKRNILLLVGSLRPQITQGKQEQILETVDQVLQKTYGDKIYYIHKVMYHKIFVWMLETEEFPHCQQSRSGWPEDYPVFKIVEMW